MSWAAQRRFIIMIIIGAIGVAFLAVLSVTVLYKTPTCTDGVQNQGEDGIDCGGPCPYLCTAQERAPTVLFTQTIDNGEGRIDVIASVENKNADAAAKNVPYTITLYNANRLPLQKVTGTLDLPPAATIPVYVPGSSGGKGVQAFLEIDPSLIKWYSLTGDPRMRPTVSNTTISGATSSPRIDATLTNASVSDMTNVQAVVFVHNVQNDVIAASQTVVPVIPAQGQAVATFTWNSAFSDVPTAIEVVPIIPLP